MIQFYTDKTKMKDFAAIDFETANNERSSVCSVGIVVVREGKIVKNILVLQNWLERIRKEVTNKVLSIKRISDFLIFPILAQPTLKKI